MVATRKLRAYQAERASATTAKRRRERERPPAAAIDRLDS
jgi:hypothetical protein